MENENKPEHITIGAKGEEIAVDLMKKKGYKIIARNWRLGHLEMDIIAANRKEIIFVEVKTRTSNFAGRPEEAVGILKRKRMVAAANAYIAHYEEERKPRFDIIGILMKKTGEILEITHLEDAFLPPVKTIQSDSFNGQWRWHHRTKTIGI